MADNELNSNFTEGDKVLSSHVKQLITALNGTFFLRLNNVVSRGLNICSALFPAETIYAENWISRGQSVDLSSISVEPNRIVSGKSRALSSKSDFFDITNSLTFKILGAQTSLVLSINGQSVTFDSDEDVTVTGGIAGSNTCQVNDSDISNDLYAGEIDYAYGGKSGYITVDGMEQEIIDRIGQFHGFKYGTNGYFYGFIDSQTKISKARRNFFYDQSGDPLVSQPLSNDNTITLLKTGWVFKDATVLTPAEVSFNYPVEAAVAPTGAEVGDYWKNTNTGRWNRYDGTQFVEVARIPIGIVLIDGNEVVAYHSFDFYARYEKTNSLELEITSETTVGIKTPGEIEVGNKKFFIENQTWDITSDLVDASEQVSTYYYLAVDENRRSRMFSIRSYYDAVKSHYHPFENWRVVGVVYNNASGDLDADDGANSYIFEKYNQKTKIDLEWSIIVDQSESSFNTASGKKHPFENPIAKPSAGEYALTPKAGFFKSNYFPLGGITHSGRMVTSPSYPAAGLSPSANMEIVLFDHQGQRVDSDYAIGVTRGGTDYLQTQLDNTLK